MFNPLSFFHFALALACALFAWQAFDHKLVPLSVFLGLLVALYLLGAGQSSVVYVSPRAADADDDGGTGGAGA